MKKCDYCAKEITYFEQYCDENCHAKANRYYENCERFAGVFSVINMICTFGIPIGFIVFCFMKPVGAAISTLCCLLLGIMLIFLPFPTEGMIKKHKIEKAVKLTRIIGLCLIGFSFIIAILFFFVFA